MIMSTRNFHPALVLRHLNKTSNHVVTPRSFISTFARTNSPFVVKKSSIATYILSPTKSNDATKSGFHCQFRSISSSLSCLSSSSLDGDSKNLTSNTSGSDGKHQTSFRPTRKRQHYRNNNHRNDYNPDKFNHLHQYSQKFLQGFAVLEYAQQTRGLAEHLRGWQPELSKLSPQQLEQILPLLDEMARSIMAIVPSSSQHQHKFWKTPQFENEALLVTVPIHGYAKLQGYYSDRYNPQRQQKQQRQNSLNILTKKEVKEDQEPYEKSVLLLRCLEEIWEATGDSRFQPLTETYSGVLDAMAKKCVEFYHDDNNDGNNKKNMQRRYTQQQQQQKNDSLQNDLPQQATDLLHHMLDLAKTQINPLAQPSNRSWNSVLNVWATLGNVDKTNELYQLMQQEFGVIPDKFTHGIITKAWVRSSRQDASYHVRQFLNTCIEQHRTNPNVHPMPNEHVFVSLIKLYCTGSNYSSKGRSHHHSRHQQQQQPDKAQEVLEEMQYWYRQQRQQQEQYSHNNNSLMIESRHFIPVMSAWAKAGNPAQVEKLLLQQQELYEQDGNEKCRPDYISFVIILDAWSKQRTWEAALKAEAILYNMEDKFLIQDGNSNKMKKQTSFANQKHNTRGQPPPSSSQRTQSSPQRMNSYAYNLVLDAYAHCGKVEKVEEVFQRMKCMATTYNRPEILPDKISYTAFIRSLIKEGKPGFVHRVESLLEKMEESSRIEDQPDTITYACVLDALSKSQQEDAGQRAEVILQRMKDHVQNGINMSAIPNEICYNTLMNIYSKLGQPEKAEETLLWMEQQQYEKDAQDNNSINNKQHRRHRLILTNVAYSTCMDAWAQVEYRTSVQKEEDGDDSHPHNSNTTTKTPLQHALDLFDRMIVNYEIHGNIKCKPTASTFAILFHALAKSKDSNSNQSRLPLALELFHDKMNKYGIGKSTVVCNSFLAAVSGTNSTDPQVSQDCLQECILLFNTMRQQQQQPQHHSRRTSNYQHRPQGRYVSMRPDSITYQKLLYAFDRFIVHDTPQQKDDAMLDLLEKCCQDGYLDLKTWELFQRFVPDEVLKDKVLPLLRQDSAAGEQPPQRVEKSALNFSADKKEEKEESDVIHLSCLPREWRRHT